MEVVQVIFPSGQSREINTCFRRFRPHVRVIPEIISKR